MEMGLDLFELARRRRSIRKFTGGPVSQEALDDILKVALLAPSSWGEHPVHFIVIRDRATLRALAACKSMGAAPLPDAEAAIVVTIDRRHCELWIEDGAVASAYILLAAEQAGVGACWIHMRDRRGQRLSSEEEIRALLDIPEGYAVLNVVALGEKGERKRPYTESELHLQNIHQERF